MRFALKNNKLIPERVAARHCNVEMANMHKTQEPHEKFNLPIPQYPAKNNDTTTAVHPSFSASFEDETFQSIKHYKALPIQQRNNTFIFNKELQLFLSGKQLLFDEVPFTVEEIQEHYENGYIAYLHGVLEEGKRHVCSRCGNRDERLFATFRCARCHELCTYCRSCIMMGRVSTCTPLLHWIGPRPTWLVPPKPLSWGGELSPGQKVAAERIITTITNVFRRNSKGQEIKNLAFKGAFVQGLGIQSLAVEIPTVQSPADQSPGIKNSVSQAPTVQNAAVKIPAVQVPGTKAPAIQGFTIKALATKGPGTQIPTVRGSATQRSTITSPAVKPSATRIPTANLPLAIDDGQGPSHGPSHCISHCISHGPSHSPSVTSYPVDSPPNQEDPTLGNPKQLGQTEILVWAVCGAGKTELLFPGIGEALKKKLRICIATPRTDVVLELAPRLKRAFPKIKIAALYGGSEDRYVFAPLTISTTHQLFRFRDAFNVVILDEVDAFPYSVDQTLQKAVQQARKKPSALIYLTATPNEKWQRECRYGKREFVTIPARYHRHRLPVPEFVWCGNWKKQLQANKLPNIIVLWVKKRIKIKKQALLFFPNILLLNKILPFLQTVEPGILAVHAADPLRKEKVQQMRDKKILMLLTTTILERGVTFPNIDVAVIGAEDDIFTESALVQISGRVGRSAQFPDGEITFFHYGKTEAMLKARKQIINMNLEAEKRGLID